ncbi:MAG: sigma-70 family RNA polymerase sigma factor [Dehalococcoidia bacterium]
MTSSGAGISASPLTDAALVLRAAAGEQEALAELYSRYVDSVFDFLFRTLRDRQEAEDATQDTFLKAMRGMGNLEQPERFKSWLFAIAHNTAMNRIRGRGRAISLDQPPPGGDDDGRPPSLDLVDDDRLGQPESALEAAQAGRLVWEAAAGLDRREYAVLDLHVRQGLTSPEIAEALEVSKNHAAVLLNRAKASLKEATAALFLSRFGGTQCPELGRRLALAGNPNFGPDVASIVRRHARGCAECQAAESRLLAPEVILAALVPIPAAAAFKAGLLASIAGGVAAVGAGTGAGAGAGLVAGAAGGGGAGGATGAGGGLGVGAIAGGGAVGVAATVLGVMFALGIFSSDEAPPPAVPEPTPTVQPVIAPPSPTATATATPTIRPTQTPTPTPSPTPTPPPPARALSTDSPPERLVIGGLAINAPITVKGLIEGGTRMDSPDGPDEIAWYGFTSPPGRPGNAVLSGHYDFIRRGPAVFFDLHTLQSGDPVALRLENGVTLLYTVLSSTLYDVETIPMPELIAGGAAPETITLITCSGDFDGADYSERLVVVAARVGLLPP